MAKDILGVGIIGCGTFCTEYLKTLGPVYKTVKVVACSDIDMERANRIAQEWGVPHPCTTDELLADFPILHLSHKVRKLSYSLFPPLETGIM